MAAPQQVLLGLKSASTLPNNLLAYYKLDESSGNASDSSGNGYTLTNSGMTYASAVINNGASCGTTRYTNRLTTTNSLGVDGGAITIAGWVKWNASAIAFDVPFGQTNSTSKTSYYIEMTSATGVDFRREKGNVGNQQVSTTQTFTVGTWYHLALTYDGSTITAYINATSKGTASASGSGSGGITSTGFSLGGRIYNSSTPINGGPVACDEFGVWSRALSASEISELYNGGAGKSYPF